MRTTKDRIVAIRTKLQDALVECNDPKLRVVWNGINEALALLARVVREEQVKAYNDDCRLETCRNSETAYHALTGL